MTAAGQPTWHYPTPVNTTWMNRAACHAHPAWTSDFKPKTPILLELAAVCATCPVQPDCAAYALDTHPHGGMYAGTWLPARHGLECNNQRSVLQRKTRPITAVTKGVTK